MLRQGCMSQSNGLQNRSCTGPSSSLIPTRKNTLDTFPYIFAQRKSQQHILCKYLYYLLLLIVLEPILTGLNKINITVFRSNIILGHN